MINFDGLADITAASRVTSAVPGRAAGQSIDPPWTSPEPVQKDRRSLFHDRRVLEAVFDATLDSGAQSTGGPPTIFPNVWLFG